MATKQFIDLDVEDIKPSTGRGGKFLLWLLSVLLFCAILVIGTVLVAQTVKFEPLIIYDYAVDKTTYCPLEQVHVTQDVEIVDRWYYTLTNLEGTTYMATPDGKPYLDSDFDVPAQAAPRGEYPSNSVRVSPPIPGEWVAAAKGKINGRMFWIIPVTQDIPEIMSPVYNVERWDAQDCLSQVLPNLEYSEEL